MFGRCYNSRKVLVTGHTGFKGSWLSMWLQGLGADVTGYSLPMDTSPNHYDLLGLDMQSVIADVLDAEKLRKTISDIRPEIIFHLAAQSLVRKSYTDPTTTIQTNVIGTMNVLEACRRCESVKAVIVITSDKCYEIQMPERPYNENSPLGGYDPYSMSKACTELVTASYRQSFFNTSHFGHSHHTLISSCRAGNVIGGGDWSEGRLLPDLVQAATSGQTVSLRKPEAIRPWQHILDLLHGYLLLGKRLLDGEKEFACSWNFGPDHNHFLTVEELAKQAKAIWPSISYETRPDQSVMHETDILRLDCSRAHTFLGWNPIWNTQHAIERAIHWYKEFYETRNVSSLRDLKEYLSEATT